tara:strand:- start:1163 stop:1294 length:132 start_codon:yes stop_codon:yes gene_type:complete
MTVCVSFGFWFWFARNMGRGREKSGFTLWSSVQNNVFPSLGFA